MEILIDAATVGDSVAIARVERDNAATAWDLAQVESEMRGCCFLGVTAKTTGGLVVGFILGRLLFDAYELLKIAVDKSCREMGIASRMMEALGSQLREKAVQSIFLEVASKNQPAIALYAKQQFKEIARRNAYYPDGDTALIMRCELR